MAYDNQLRTAALYQAAECDPSAEPASQAPRSNGPNLLLCATTFCSFAIAAMVIAAAAFWWVGRETSANPSADAFLWFAGKDKTWDQYQKGKKSSGHGRLDEKKHDWMQQAVNDAYSNR